jgi:hypothetical protein
MSDFYQSKSDRELLLTMLRKLDALHDTLESLSGQTDFVFRQAKRHQPSITSVTITQPSGDTITMSGTQPTTIGPFTLTLKNASQTKNGSATFPIGISNSDGSAPTISTGDNSVVTGSITGPNADGSYTGNVTAVGAGNVPVNISADGVIDTVMNFVVNAAPLETATVDPTKVVINAPA